MPELPEVETTMRLIRPPTEGRRIESVTVGWLRTLGGTSLRSFRKVASGGELSRVFLAIKAALRASAAGMVLVFDEVDAGVGGRAADGVGRSLAELAAHHQVLCITHLPQIAVYADRHFHVSKSREGDRTVSNIRALDEDARREEIARMMGGLEIDDATRAAADALLLNAQQARA